MYEFSFFAASSLPGWDVLSDEQRAMVEEWVDTKADDATWILTSAFVILTMQSGFGLLESGSAQQRFEVNVMMKNVIDVLFGGLSYWLMGYGLSYGKSFHGMFGTSEFFVNLEPSIIEMALSQSEELYSHYLFQFTFASTATTIVSGCVAGRMKFSTYILFSFVNSFIYSVACHWTWAPEGWLKELGFVDFAGAAPVHLMGGLNGLVATWKIGPRAGRWDPDRQEDFGLQHPANCVLGLFMLWWGWLGFSCGSTFGITHLKWMVASRVAVTTINASMGAGVTGVAISAALVRGVVEVEHVVNGVLGGLVAITAACASVSPAEAFFIGIVGALLTALTNLVLVRYRILDDPVGAVGVHAASSIWGILAVGLFAHDGFVGGPQSNGLFHGGGLELLGHQIVGVVAIGLWTVGTSLLGFWAIDRAIGLRAGPEEEAKGFDAVEHNANSPDLQEGYEALSEEVFKVKASLDIIHLELKALRDEFLTCENTSSSEPLRVAALGVPEGRASPALSKECSSEHPELHLEDTAETAIAETTGTARTTSREELASDDKCTEQAGEQR